MNVALIGFGLSGSVFHAPFILAHPHLKLKTIVSSRREKVYEQFPNVLVAATLQEAIADEDIDIVIITSPNQYHKDQAVQALEANKHVVIEKPMVTSVEEAQQIISLAKEKQRTVSVYQNRRWDSDFLTVQKVINEQKIGSIHTYEAHYDRYRPHVTSRWREQDIAGSGILFDLGSHLIDQAITLFGHPQFVTGELLKDREGSVIDDGFHIILHHVHTRAILRSSSLVVEQGPKFKVDGTKGSFLKFGQDPQEALLKTGKYDIHDLRWGSEPREDEGRLIYMKDEERKQEKIPTEQGNYLHFYTNLYDHLTKKAPLAVPAEDALMTMKVIAAVQESHQEKRTITLK